MITGDPPAIGLLRGRTGCNRPPKRGPLDVKRTTSSVLRPGFYRFVPAATSCQVQVSKRMSLSPFELSL